KDHQLYKFIEGDFPRLNLRDIEDMILLLVQKKLSNLERGDLFDLNVALRMFTRRIIILKRVEDLQLEVESYKKKLNITRPETFRSDITKMASYTAYNDPQGIIYQDKFQRNKLMRSDELYKFCDLYTPSPQPSNLFLDDIMDAPPRPSYSLLLQSHPLLDITLSLSPIILLDHILDTPSPPSPQLQSQPPLTGHLIYFNMFDYHGVNFLCCFHNQNLVFSLRDEMNLMFAHLEYLLTSAIASPSPPHP
nr:hypothetical protein [Tanacetum cinerariifolium]